MAAVAGAAGLLLVAMAGRYGWHRDELYFLEAGEHLQWGYVDQPPFTPFVARLADAVAPGNLVVLRLLPAVSAVVAIVLTARLAAELGGGRRAQIIAAGAVAGGGFLLGVNHLLSTAAFDFTAWVALLWITARLLRTGNTRWWVLFGAVAGAAMLNKHLVPLLVGSLAVGIVGERRWDLLRSRWLAVGIGLAALIAAPNLIWQATNGWPQVDMARVLSDRLGAENRLTLLPVQALFVGPLLAPLLWRGARWLRRHPAAIPYRPLLWAWPAGLGATFVTAGRPYYILPLTTVVVIAGVISAERDGAARRLPWRVAINAALTIPISLPLLPVSTLPSTGAASLNEAVAETVGWPELAEQVASVVRSLPPGERGDVVLLAATYGEAGALDRFGPEHGLPEAFSPHNHYWYFRRPTNDAATVVAIRWPEPFLTELFRDCVHAGDVDNGLDVDNEVQGQPIFICRHLNGTWAEVWPRLKFLA